MQHPPGSKTRPSSLEGERTSCGRRCETRARDRRGRSPFQGGRQRSGESRSPFQGGQPCNTLRARRLARPPSRENGLPVAAVARPGPETDAVGPPFKGDGRGAEKVGPPFKGDSRATPSGLEDSPVLPRGRTDFLWPPLRDQGQRPTRSVPLSRGTAEERRKSVPLSRGTAEERSDDAGGSPCQGRS